MQLVSSGLTYGQTGTRVSTGMDSQNSQQQNEAPRAAQQQLLTSLSANLNQLQIEEVMNADPTDFSAEKVSSRIADFVASGIANAAARGATAERLESMYQAAVTGVQKGFAEAKAILEGMPQYVENEPVQALVANTEEMTFAKLDELNPAGSSEPVDSGLAAAVDYRESMKLRLVTQDGDKVEIQFNSRESYRFTSQGEAWGLDSSQRSGFQFEVAQYESVERQAHPEHPWAQRLQNWLEPVAELQQKSAALISNESISLREMLLQAIDVRGEKPGFPPGLGRVLAQRLA